MPAVTVGGINSPAAARFGLVGGWAGHEPTAASYRTHKGRSFSLCWDHGSSGHQRELPTQVFRGSGGGGSDAL